MVNELGIKLAKKTAATASAAVLLPEYSASSAE